MPTLPEIDDMFTIAPLLFSRITAAAARRPFQVPFRCTAITWSNWSSVILRIVASRVMPALLTMMSSPPKPSTAAATSASTSSELVTSQRTARATSLPPRLSAAACVASQVHVTEHDTRAFGDETLARSRSPDPGLHR